jgi:hypothetical protein
MSIYIRLGYVAGLSQSIESLAHGVSVIRLIALALALMHSTDVCMRSGAGAFSLAVPRSAMQQVREDCKIRTVKNPASEYAPKVCAASPLKRKRQEVEGCHFGGRATSRRGAEEGSDEGKDPRRRGNAREAATVRSAAVIGAVAAMKILENDLGAEENAGEEIGKQRSSCYLASYGTTEKDSAKEERGAGGEEGGGEAHEAMENFWTDAEGRRHAVEDVREDSEVLALSQDEDAADELFGDAGIPAAMGPVTATAKIKESALKTAQGQRARNRAEFEVYDSGAHCAPGPGVITSHPPLVISSPPIDRN